MESVPTHAQKTSAPAPARAREFGIGVPRDGFEGIRALQAAALGLTILVYVLLRLRHLGQYSLWYDEVFSVLAARSSWSGMFRQILIDRVHPPGLLHLLEGLKSPCLAKLSFGCWDNSSDPLLPAGIRPTDLISRGCQLQELAKAHGQGHEFTVFHVNCY